MYRAFVPALILLSLIACETTETDALFPRCNPILDAPLSPEEGLEGDQITLSGTLITAQTTALDPFQDVLITFGNRQATLLEVGERIDGYDGACSECQVCVSSAVEGCVGCEASCTACEQSIVVAAPKGAGSVPVTLINSRGTSNSVTFTYLSTPTPSPSPSATQSASPSLTPSPTETQATPTQTPGTQAPSQTPTQ